MINDPTNTRDPATATDRPTRSFTEGTTGELAGCRIGIANVATTRARISVFAAGSQPGSDQDVGADSLLIACEKLFRVRSITAGGSSGAPGSSRSTVEIETEPAAGTGITLRAGSWVLTKGGRLKLESNATLEGLQVSMEGGVANASLTVVTGQSRRPVAALVGESFEVDDQRLRVLQVLIPDQARGISGWLELERW